MFNVDHIPNILITSQTTWEKLLLKDYFLNVYNHYWQYTITYNKDNNHLSIKNSTLIFAPLYWLFSFYHFDLWKYTKTDLINMFFLSFIKQLNIPEKQSYIFFYSYFIKYWLYWENWTHSIVNNLNQVKVKKEYLNVNYLYKDILKDILLLEKYNVYIHEVFWICDNKSFKYEYLKLLFIELPLLDFKNLVNQYEIDVKKIYKDAWLNSFDFLYLSILIWDQEKFNYINWFWKYTNKYKISYLYAMLANYKLKDIFFLSNIKEVYKYCHITISTSKRYKQLYLDYIAVLDFHKDDMNDYIDFLYNEWFTEFDIHFYISYVRNNCNNPDDIKSFLLKNIWNIIKNNNWFDVYHNELNDLIYKLISSNIYIKDLFVYYCSLNHTSQNPHWRSINDFYLYQIELWNSNFENFLTFNKDIWQFKNIKEWFSNLIKIYLWLSKRDIVNQDVIEDKLRKFSPWLSKNNSWYQENESDNNIINIIKLIIENNQDCKKYLFDDILNYIKTLSRDNIDKNLSDFTFKIFSNEEVIEYILSFDSLNFLNSSHSQSFLYNNNDKEINYLSYFIYHLTLNYTQSVYHQNIDTVIDKLWLKYLELLFFSLSLFKNNNSYKDNTFDKNFEKVNILLYAFLKRNHKNVNYFNIYIWYFIKFNLNLSSNMKVDKLFMDNILLSYIKSFNFSIDKINNFQKFLDIILLRYDCYENTINYLVTIKDNKKIFLINNLETLLNNSNVQKRCYKKSLINDQSYDIIIKKFIDNIYCDFSVLSQNLLHVLILFLNQNIEDLFHYFLLVQKHKKINEEYILHIINYLNKNNLPHQLFLKILFVNLSKNKYIIPNKIESNQWLIYSVLQKQYAVSN